MALGVMAELATKYWKVGDRVVIKNTDKAKNTREDVKRVCGELEHYTVTSMNGPWVRLNGSNMGWLWEHFSLHVEPVTLDDDLFTL